MELKRFKMAVIGMLILVLALIFIGYTILLCIKQGTCELTSAWITFGSVVGGIVTIAGLFKRYETNRPSYNQDGETNIIIQKNHEESEANTV